MDTRVTTEQLIFKIGALTMEIDLLRAQVAQLQEALAEQKKNTPAEKTNAR